MTEHSIMVELAPEGFVGWVVERITTPEGLFPSRDAAAKWLIGPEIEYY